MDRRTIEKKFEQDQIDRVKVGGFDVDGVLRGKYISLEKFWSAVDSGFGFCDVIFGWDIQDTLYDNVTVTGWGSGYPDAHAKLDLSTYRAIPWEPGVAAFLTDFYTPGGSKPHPACPRNLLKQVVEKVRGAGFAAKVAVEFEFFVFKETADTLHEKSFSKLQSLSPGMFGYSWLREGQHAELCQAIMRELGAFDIQIEGLHTETGPGVYEAALRYDDPMRMADKAALFKTAMKELCARRGLSVTFMAKWNADLPGSSGHLHQSLWLGDGKTNAFFDQDDAQSLSLIARQYLAGLVELAPELTALYSPTVNSYKRYVPGVWAPLTASWGVENRTVAVRAIPGGTGTRLEYRQTAADINPYIALATCLASGLHGIKRALDCPPESHGDASKVSGFVSRFPTSLKDANRLLASSTVAREILGDAFVDHYVRTRDWEIRQYERAVTNWELQRYFESV